MDNYSYKLELLEIYRSNLRNKISNLQNYLVQMQEVLEIEKKDLYTLNETIEDLHRLRDLEK